MDLTAVLELRDRLSANMEKASNSVGNMIKRANEAKDAIRQLSGQNAKITASTNIADTIANAKARIDTLRSDIESKQLELDVNLGKDFDVGKLDKEIQQLTAVVNEGAPRISYYESQLESLNQVKLDFEKIGDTAGAQRTVEEMGKVQENIDEIRRAQQTLAEKWYFRMEYSDIENAKAELQTLEKAVEQLNSTNVAVRAYMDFKSDALKQIYDIDEKAQQLSKKVFSPVIELRDKISEKLKPIQDKLTAIKSKAFSAAVELKDKITAPLQKVRSALVNVAAYVAYPVVKIKDMASSAVSKVRSTIEGISQKPWVVNLKSKVDDAKQRITAVGTKIKEIAGKAWNVVITAKDKISSALGSIKDKIFNLKNLLGTLVIGGIGAASIKAGSEFEASMSQVAATMGMTADEANYSNAAYAKLANVAKEMGASTKFSASQAGEALNYLALAGYDADKACNALPTILNLAAAGGMELASASDMVTDAMSALGIEATQQNLTQFGDQLAKTAQKSNTSVSQLGEAILTVGGSAKTLAGGTTELNTMLGILADNGMKGSEGGTKLRNIILGLQAPTDVAAKKLKSLGVSAFDADGKMRPMNEVLGDLNSSLSTMSDAARQDALSTIFNKQDLTAATALLDNCGARFDELSGYVADSDGAMQAMADTMNDNLTGRITEFKSALEGAGIAIYEALGSSSLKDVVQEASGWITQLTHATEEGGLEGLASSFGDVLAQAIASMAAKAPDVINVAMTVITSFIQGLASNMPSIVSAGVQLIGTLINGLVSNVPLIISSGLTIVSSLIDGLLQCGPMLIAGAVNLIVAIVQGLLQNVNLLISGAMTLVNALANSLIANIPLLLNAAVQLVTGLVQGITQNLPIIIQGAINLIKGLLTGLIQNLPAIISAGVQIVVTLAGGLIQAIPQLIAAIPELVGSIINTIMETDWLQVGWDIISGIGNGILGGIAGLFGSGEDAATSVADGITAGSGQITNSAQTAITSAGNAVNVDFTGKGTEAMTTFNAGLTTTPIKMPEIDTSTLTTNFTTAGTTAMTDFNTSLLTNQPLVTETMTTTATDMQTAITGADFLGTGTTVMTDFNTGLVNTQPSALETATATATGIKANIEAVDLTASGANIMQGLVQGMISEQQAAFEVAQQTASGIQSSFNSAMQIHSPSKVMAASGEDTAAGVVVGLDDMSNAVNKAAESMGANVAAGYAAAPSVTDFYSNGSMTGPVYDDMLAATPEGQPTNIFNESYTTNNSGVGGGSGGAGGGREVFIQNIIGEVHIHDEADEDRLVDKIIGALADDVEETAENMPEEVDDEV